MKENIEEYHQTQIYQSFTNFDNNSNNNMTYSPKKDSIEFTFKKNIYDSNKSKHSEKNNEQNIYSKNDENIIQSGHFFNGEINESKFKILLKNIEEKNNIIKPLFNYIIHKKKTAKKLNNKKKCINLNKTKINSLKNGNLKKELQINNTIKNKNNNIKSNTSNVITIKNNNKYILNFITKESINTFLEISHGKIDNNDYDNNTIEKNENKENINNQNINIKRNTNDINLNRKIFNEILKNKSANQKNKNRKRDKIQKNKFEENSSFELLKNEYKQLKQKINENKKMNKKPKRIYQCKSTVVKHKNIKSDKKMTLNKKIFKINTTNGIYYKKNFKSKNIHNLKNNKLSYLNLSNIDKNNFIYNNNMFNSHRRLNSLSNN